MGGAESIETMTEVQGAHPPDRIEISRSFQFQMQVATDARNVPRHFCRATSVRFLGAYSIGFTGTE
jgi:hypothetical protein